jgi:hypothetical protein
MKSRPEVQPRKILKPLKLIQNFIDQKHREFVLHCYGIQSMVINTKSPGSILFCTSKTGEAKVLVLVVISPVSNNTLTYFSISSLCKGEYLYGLELTVLNWAVWV